MNDAIWLALIGLGSGILLGLAARLGRFCSLGAIEDIVYGDRYYRALMWPTAMGWSMIGLGLLSLFGHFALEESVYLRFAPNYGGHIVGGLIFGYGMALAGMCGFTALARLGTGDMRALVVVLILGIFAYIAASGILAPLRDNMFHYSEIGEAAPPSIAFHLGKAFGLAPEIILIAIGLILALLPLLRKNFRRSKYPFWAMLIAAGIVLGWWGTYFIAENNLGNTRIESHTFNLPLGDSLVFLMLSTGVPISFGVGSVAGVILGAVIGSLIKREFSWEACDDARELRRHLLGAALMGIGALIAFGCSIGQGLSAMSVLSFSAPITLASIGIGSYIGLKYLIEG